MADGSRSVFLDRARLQARMVMWSHVRLFVVILGDPSLGSGQPHLGLDTPNPGQTPSPSGPDPSLTCDVLGLHAESACPSRRGWKQATQHSFAISAAIVLDHNCEDRPGPSPPPNYQET